MYACMYVCMHVCMSDFLLHYITAGYPSISRSQDIIFCSWNCAKMWNHQNSHAIIKQRTEDLITREEEIEEQQQQQQQQQQQASGALTTR